MPVDITAHPNYTKEATEYQAALSQATQDGDPAAIERVKADWERKRGSMQGDLYERQDQERTRQTTLTTIKAEHPDVPEEVYANVADPEQARSIAKSVQDKLNAAKGPGEGSWSPPPGGGTPQGNGEKPYEEMTQEERDQWREHRLSVLAPEVMEKGAMARKQNEELQKVSLQPLLDRFVPGKRSR